MTYKVDGYFDMVKNLNMAASNGSTFNNDKNFDLVTNADARLLDELPPPAASSGTPRPIALAGSAAAAGAAAYRQARHISARHARRPARLRGGGRHAFPDEVVLWEACWQSRMRGADTDRPSPPLAIRRTSR